MLGPAKLGRAPVPAPLAVSDSSASAPGDSAASPFIGPSASSPVASGAPALLYPQSPEELTGMKRRADRLIEETDDWLSTLPPLPGAGTAAAPAPVLSDEEFERRQLAVSNKAARLQERAGSGSQEAGP